MTDRPTTEEARNSLWTKMIEHAPSPLVRQYRDQVEADLLQRLNDEAACFDHGHSTLPPEQGEPPHERCYIPLIDNALRCKHCEEVWPCGASRAASGAPAAPPPPLDARDPIAQAKFALHRLARTTEDAQHINRIVDALAARLSGAPAQEPPE